MNIVCATVPDAFSALTQELRRGDLVDTRLGPFRECINLTLTVVGPCTRAVFLKSDPTGQHERYLAAQWAWYSRGTQDLWIKAYDKVAWDRMPEGSTDINSNYGQYVWMEGQFVHCLSLLKKDPTSRRAIIMFNRPGVSMSGTKDHICTTSLQFLVRNSTLHTIATMRSNELNFGFRTDTFFFTLLQEIMAKELGLPVGSYYHNVGSFHVRENEFRQVDSKQRHTWPRYSPGELPHLVPGLSYDKDTLKVSKHSKLAQHIDRLLKTP